MILSNINLVGFTPSASKGSKTPTIKKRVITNSKDELGSDFGLWFAALITLALNGDLINASINLFSQTNSHEFINVIAKELWVNSEADINISYNESYEDSSSYLVSEHWVSADSDIS